MKIVHIDSGLGNQMLGYCEYLAIKKMNPSDECVIETLVYEIPECSATICQWNGYELERVFNIQAKNISELLGKEKIDKVKTSIVKSEFWKKNWNFSPYYVEAFREVGIDVINNCRITSEQPLVPPSKVKTFLKAHGADIVKYHVGRMKQYLAGKKYQLRYNDCKHTFLVSERDVFTGQRFSFIHTDNGIERIDKEIREAFVFPDLPDERNRKIAEELKKYNSVAIHARRGDMLGRTGVYYTGGYFKRAVQYIKKHVDHPRFYFFCDPGSSVWCKENLKVFGLNDKVDFVCFVDWNKGDLSYIDMQLMAMCKHNIVTNSSFGWWGAYLNTNPNKITCSPDRSYNTTHHF